MLSIIAKHGDVKSDIHRVYDEVTNIINDFNICHSGPFNFLVGLYLLENFSS